MVGQVPESENNPKTTPPSSAREASPATTPASNQYSVVFNQPHRDNEGRDRLRHVEARHRKSDGKSEDKDEDT